METNIIKNIMKEENRWWKTEFIHEYKDRKIYRAIKKFLAVRQIVALTGLRRVGKTTIMFKIVQDFLEKNFDKQHILYFSFDEFPKKRLREILEMYEDLLDKDISKGNYLILFDEIQKVENWQEQLKRLYDSHKNVKFVISGSESLFIRNKSKESLAGRIYEFLVRPLDFKEYLTFKGKAYNNPELYKKEIIKELNQYLYTNGFPELINEEREVIIKYITENVIGKIIDSDMPNVFDLRNTSEVRAVFNVIYNDPGQIIEIQELSSDLGLDRNKVSYILECLEKAYLIKKLYNYSKNARKTERSLKRFYPSLFNPYLINDNFPKIFETCIVLNLDAEYFWRDVYKHEVDIVLKNKEVTPIEVKSGKIELKGLLAFMKKFNVKKGFVISSTVERKVNTNGNSISIIPAWKLLVADKRSIL